MAVFYKMSKSFSIRRTVIATTMLLSLTTACAENIVIRGNDPNPDMINMIQEGEQTRRDVEALLGSPSSTAIFDNETWYYISSRFKRVAFFAPEEISRKVVAISFAEDGYVKDMASFSLEDGKVVQMSGRTTPTAGNEIGLLEQLLGNLGKIN